MYVQSCCVGRVISAFFKPSWNGETKNARFVKEIVLLLGEVVVIMFLSTSSSHKVIIEAERLSRISLIILLSFDLFSESESPAEEKRLFFVDKSVRTFSFNLGIKVELMIRFTMDIMVYHHATNLCDIFNFSHIFASNIKLFLIFERFGC